MFGNYLITREYFKNKKLYNYIKEDKNIPKEIKEEYLVYLKDREIELEEEKKAIKKTIDELRELYNNIDDKYLKKEISNNIIELIEKLNKKI